MAQSDDRIFIRRVKSESPVNIKVCENSVGVHFSDFDSPIRYGNIHTLEYLATLFGLKNKGTRCIVTGYYNMCMHFLHQDKSQTSKTVDKPKGLSCI